MVTVKLSPSGTKKILKGIFELYMVDFDQSLKSMTPGQWCVFELARNQEIYFGYINPHVLENRPIAYVVGTGTIDDPWNYIKGKIHIAIEKRKNIFGYGLNSRLVYGASDEIPGLIIDCYKNSVFIQINTAGLDRYREEIEILLKDLCPNRIIMFLDNESYRKGEGLPVFSRDYELDKIEIDENGLQYEINVSKKQKIGYYYDHRINRSKAASLVKMLNRENLKGLDLFCYIGSWGMNLLQSNLQFVDFVDQGDFSEEIEKNLELNGFSNRGHFTRANVFDFLKNATKTYDVICSDPPAFCKSKKEKQRAIDGYKKLHKMCLEKINTNGIFIAASCTHYVNHEEFQQTVIQAAKQIKRNIQLIDVGMQGLDHPINSTYSKESYLKYYAYYVE